MGIRLNYYIYITSQHNVTFEDVRCTIEGMKYKGSNVALGVVLILLSLFSVGNINFSSNEQAGGSIFTIGLIIGGVYLIKKGLKR